MTKKKPATSTLTKSPYKNQAKKLLENSFPLISCAVIDSVFQHVDYDFTEAFHILSDIRPLYNDGEKAKAIFPHINKTIKVFLKHERIKKRFDVTDPHLRDETNDIPELNTKENNPPPPKVATAASAAAVNDFLEDNGDEDDDDLEELLECGCCYGDYRKRDMKECSGNAGHKVCKECIYRYVSEQLDGNDSVVFQCIVNQDCTCTYAMVLLDEILSPKLKKRTNDRIFREEVKKAGLDCWICPTCAYMGFVERQYKIMTCPECEVTYCTSCNQVEHPKKTCDDAQRERKRLNDPVFRAHEIMSTAVKRRCPQCAVEFVKSDGCNKMRCKCGTLSCYLCGLKIKDYSHFCAHTGACKCKKNRCKLWTSTQAMEERDRMARQEAGRKELQAAGMPEDEIQRILASPPIKKKATSRVPTVNNVPGQRPQARQGHEAAVLGPAQPQPQGIIDRMLGEAGGACIIS